MRKCFLPRHVLHQVQMLWYLKSLIRDALLQGAKETNVKTHLNDLMDAVPERDSTCTSCHQQPQIIYYWAQASF